jgi:hypothetical protein
MEVKIFIVEPAHYRWWLENKPGSDLFEAALNSPLQTPLKIYPVSNRAASSRCG